MAGVDVVQALEDLGLGGVDDLAEWASREDERVAFTGLASMKGTYVLPIRGIQADGKISWRRDLGMRMSQTSDLSRKMRCRLKTRTSIWSITQMRSRTDHLHRDG